MLWSRSFPPQRASSLRQALSDIRRAFDPYQACFVSDRRMVGLVADAVEVEFRVVGDNPADGPVPSTQTVLLEGLEGPDPNFDDWLAAERARQPGFGDVAQAVQRPLRTPAPAVDRTLPVLRQQAHGVWIRSMPIDPSASRSESLVAKIIAQSVLSGVQELSAADVCAEPRDGPGVELSVEASAIETGMLVIVALHRFDDRQMIWTGREVLPAGESVPVSEFHLQRLVNQVTDIALIGLRRALQSSEENSPFFLAFDAIQRMFRIDPSELATAEEQLKGAFDQRRSGIFLAWRSYLKTFLAAEHRGDMAALGEEARMLSIKARELDPQNSYVLALCSYVHCFLLSEHEAGHELAVESLRYNPGNPLSLAHLGRAKTYLGDLQGGYDLTRRAHLIAGPSPYRHTLDFLGGLTATLAGKHQDAVQKLEVASSLKANYKAPLRYLLTLYLNLNNSDKALHYFNRLRESESDFSMRLMRDDDYPAHGLRDHGYLDDVDEEFGL